MDIYKTVDDIKKNIALTNLEEKLQIEVDLFEDCRSKDVTKGGNGVFYPAGENKVSDWHPFIRIDKPVEMPLLVCFLSRCDEPR